MTNKYKLVNQIKKEKHLAAIRRQVLTVESAQALDIILGSPTPATLAQSFSEQDFHFLMHTIGPYDFLPILALASFDQWEYLLDVETWEGDRINLPMVTNVLALLFKADPERLVRWMIKEKTEFFELYLFKNMEIRILEENEDPSDFPDGFQTIDNLFYVRFPEIPQQILDQEGGAEADQAREKAETFIMEMLNKVADMDLSVSHALLLETGTVIPAEIEEEELRLKVFRLAEKGFLPRYEAVGIYQPLEPSNLSPRPTGDLKKQLFGSEYSLPALYPASLLKNDSLFASSLAGVDETMLLNLQLELATLVNRISSADGGVVRERQDLERIVQKGCAFLSLGMEVLHQYGKDHGEPLACTPQDGAAIIAKYSLADIFRAGSWIGLTLKNRARQWYKKSWLSANGLTLHFFDEEWLGLLGGLLLDRPLFFDNYRTGELYRPFSTLEEIKSADRSLGQIIEIDRMMELINPDLKTFVQGLLTFKSVLLTLWAKSCLGLDSSLEPVRLSDFIPFFTELFSGDSPGTIDDFKRDDFIHWLAQKTGIADQQITQKMGAVVKDIFDWLQDEYGKVPPAALDPRFVTGFFIKG